MKIPKTNRRALRKFVQELEIERHIEWRNEIDERIDNEADIESICLLTEAMCIVNEWEWELEP